MPLPNLIAMQVVAERLVGVGLPYAFVGGSIVSLLLDNPEISPARPTDDVDVILEVTTSLRYSDVEARIRSCGFEHDMKPGAPKCRWILGNLTVDIMPTDGAFLGLNTMWFEEALSSAEDCKFDRGKLRLISPTSFLATKYVAFLDRGKGDYHGSLDLEDFVTVIDGRANIAAEVSQSAERMRRYVVNAVQTLLASPHFVEALPGFLPSKAGERQLLALQRKLNNISSIRIS
jgi:hypothetical protein